MAKCVGVCARTADGVKGRYATNLKYCVKCHVSFRTLKELCACCGYRLRHKARGQACLDNKHPPGSRYVELPPPNRPLKPGTAEQRRHRDCCRRVYWRDPEHWRAKRREYYVANREQSIAATTAWRKANPERARANCRASYRRHREARIAKSVKWARDNPERTREYHRHRYAAIKAGTWRGRHEGQAPRMAKGH